MDELIDWIGISKWLRMGLEKEKEAIQRGKENGRGKYIRAARKMTTIRAIGLRAGTISMFPEQHEARQLRHTSTRHVMMRGSQRVPVLGHKASIHGGARLVS